MVVPCTVAHTSTIPMGAIHARTLFTLADTITPMFTVITEVWPRANRAVATNNSPVIIKVVLIEGLLSIYDVLTMTSK